MKDEKEKRNRRFGMLDRISYAAGDFGCNMSFALAGTWFTVFWTQYMKIDSITFAAVLMLLKVGDILIAPAFGAYMDRGKEYKRGKFKHFIFYGSFGLAIAAALCFIPVKNADKAVKIILCVFGYLLWDLFYTVVNVPYGSMLSVISSDPGERAELGAWRFLGCMSASLPIGMILPLLLYDENQELMGERLFLVALILGFIGLGAFMFMVHNTVERVDYRSSEKKRKEKYNGFKALMDFFHNRAAIGATIIPVGMFFGMTGAMTATQVMFQSYFRNPAYLGAVSLCTMLPSLLVVPFVKPLTKRFGKKEAAGYGMYISLFACIMMCIVPIPPDTRGVITFLVLLAINGLGTGVASCLGDAMMADAIDYNEWKTGKREEGTTYSMHSLCRKLIQGIGPSLGLVLMVAIGYDEQLGSQQPFEVALKLRYLVAIFYLAATVIMYIGARFVFNLDRKTLEKMNRELGR